MPPASTPPTLLVDAGVTLERVHGHRRPPRWYGERDATWRYDAPDGAYGVRYAGLTLDGPFAEVFLRAPAQREVLQSVVDLRRHATFATTRPLRLAKVFGPGLAWFGVELVDVCDGYEPLDRMSRALAYAAPQAVSARVHALAGYDGLAYLSRFDTDGVCVALFDRADDALAPDVVSRPLDPAWVEAFLDARGIALIDA